MTGSNPQAQAEEGNIEHRAHIGVECPQCHWKQFVEIHFDQPLEETPVGRELRGQLEAWMASRCPDHLSAISKFSRN